VSAAARGPAKDKPGVKTTRAPAPASAAPEPELVSAVGNQTAMRLFALAAGSAGGGAATNRSNEVCLHHATNMWVQTKLRVATPNDPFEREADRVADVTMSEPNQDQEPALEPTAVPGTSTEATTPAPPSVHLALGTARDQGFPLPPDTREFMESRIGHDFSAVRIHADVTANELNRDLRSLAFTRGRDIYFADGQFQPRTTTGQRLLAHELTHVVQQAPSPRAAPPSVVARQVVPGTDANRTDFGIDTRTFAEIWAEFERLRDTQQDDKALALTAALVAKMSTSDALEHAGDLAVWLIHHNDRERASLALDQLESALWVQYATGARVSGPLWMSGGLGSPITPEGLTVEGEHEAAAGQHRTGRQLLGIAHLMIQLMLDYYYRERQRTAENAATLGEGGQFIIDAVKAMEGGDVEKLTALRTRILNVYPRLAAEQRRAGNLVSAFAIGSEGQALSEDLGGKYTLADLPDVTNLDVAVGRTTRASNVVSPGDINAVRPVTPSRGSTRSAAQTGAHVAAPRTVGPDRVVDAPPPFQDATVLALHGNHYVSVKSERYAVSELLTRATAWAQNLFGVKSSIVLMHVDTDGVIRYYVAALDEDLRETFPPGNPLETIGVDVAVRIERVPPDYEIMVIHVGNGFGFWPSPRRDKAYQTVVSRESTLPIETTHLAPELVRTRVFARIDALMANEEENLEEIARLLSQLNATAFAVLSSKRRFDYLSVLIRAWTFQAQERAIVEIMKSIESYVELQAMIERLKEAKLWSKLINDLDNELWSLLMTVGERFGQQTLTVRDIYKILDENKLLRIGTPIPGLSIGPNGPEFSIDALAELQEAANGFLRFVEGIWDAIVMLITHPDKIIEGLVQLTRMMAVFKLAEYGYPPAMQMRDQILAGFGRQLLNGFRGIAVLGVGEEVVRRIKWAIIWEIASFFIGIGEIKAAMEAVGVSARVGAIARFLRLLGLVGRVAEVEETTSALTRLARILSSSGRALRTEEEVLVGLSHLPDAEVTRLGRLLEGLELKEGMTLTQLRQLHPELAEAAEASLKRAEIVHQLAAKAGGFSDELARAFARMSGAGHSTEDLARIVSHIPSGEGSRFLRMFGRITDDAALAGPRGLATLEVLGQSATRMQAVERFGFHAVDAIMAHTGRDAATLDKYLEALAAIEKELPEATRAARMQELVEALGRGDADALARLDAKVGKSATPAVAQGAAHGIPEWQENSIKEILDDAEDRGLLHVDRSVKEAEMRAQIAGKSDDEVTKIFNQWEKDLDIESVRAEQTLPRSPAKKVDVPTQDLPVTPREPSLGVAEPGVRDLNPKRVEVGPKDIADFRTRHPTLTKTRDTIGVARSDVKGFEDITLEGASPAVRSEAGMPPQAVGPIESPSGLAMERFHAEQDIANQFAERAERLGLKQSDFEGRTLAMHISNPRGVCWVCRSGFNDPDALPGVLRQLSERYPGLTIRVTVDGPPGAEIGYKSLIFNSGKLLFE